MNYLIKESINHFRSAESLFGISGNKKTMATVLCQMHQAIEFCVKGILLQRNILDKSDQHHLLGKLSKKLLLINKEIADSVSLVSWLNIYNAGGRYEEKEIDKNHTFLQARNVLVSLLEYCGALDEEYESYMHPDRSLMSCRNSDFIFNCHLPVSIDKFTEASSAIEFRGESICSNVITFSFRDMLAVSEEAMKKKFTTKNAINLFQRDSKEEMKYMILLNGVTLWLRKDVLEGLENALRDITKEFLANLKDIENSISGLSKEVIISDEGNVSHKIVRISQSLWRDMLSFCESIVYSNNLEFNVVNSNGFSDSAMIHGFCSKKQLCNDFTVKANYDRIDAQNSTVSLVVEYNDTSYFLDKNYQVWDLNQIRDWFINELLPRSLHWVENKKLKVLSKSYNKFIQSYSCEDYVLIEENKKDYNDDATYLDRLLKSF